MLGIKLCGTSPSVRALTDSWRRWCEPLPTGYQVSVPGLRARELVAKQPLVPTCCQMPQRKTLDGAAPYARWKFSPKSVPSSLLRLESSQNIKHKNTQLVVASQLISTCLFAVLFSSRSHILCLVIAPRMHRCLGLIFEEICSRCYLLSFHLLFAVVGSSSHSQGLTATPERPFSSSVLFLSADFSPQLSKRRLNSPYCLCARIKTPASSPQIPGSIKINQRIPFCRGNCLGWSQSS